MSRRDTRPIAHPIEPFDGQPVQVADQPMGQEELTAVRQLVDVPRRVLELQDLLDRIMGPAALGSGLPGLRNDIRNGGAVALDAGRHHARESLEHSAQLESQRVLRLLGPQIDSNPFDLEEICGHRVVEGNRWELEGVHGEI